MKHLEYKVYFLRIALASPVLGKLRRFAMPQTIEDHSFCFNSISKLDALEVLTDLGICYAFNSDSELFDQRTFVALRCLIFYSKKIFICRVSPDFLDYRTITSECDESFASSLKTFEIDMYAELERTCDNRDGSFRIHQPEAFSSGEFFELRHFSFTRILLDPKITTTDNALRKYSPEMYVQIREIQLI